MSIQRTGNTLILVLLMWAWSLAAQPAMPGQGNTDKNYVQLATDANTAVQEANSSESQPANLEIFGGYSWINTNAIVTGSVNVGSPPVSVPVTLKLKDARKGFVVDISYFFNRWFGFTLDGGGHFGDNYNHGEVLAGPAVRFQTEHLQPFLHVLGGWARLSPINASSKDGGTLAGGGGLDLKVARHLSIRLAQVDYLYSRHQFGIGNSKAYHFVRASTGLVFLVGGGEETPPVSATCSVDKAEVWAGEPVKASVAARNFNPKHKLSYDWTTNGGKVEGSGDTVTVNTAGVAEGQSYNVSVHVSDPKEKKDVTTCQTSFATKKRLPPTISCSANPTSVVQGGAITIHSDAASPQGGPVTVAVTSSCGANGQGTDVSLDASAIPPGSCSVTCTVTDDHQLTASSSTSFTVQPKPVVKPPQPPPSLTLRSVYFATAYPTVKDPNGGLLKSQQDTLKEIAASFIKYLAVKPDATLILEAHADPRGSEDYNLKLTERRASRVKSFLTEQGVPSDRLETRALGEQHQLTPEEVRQSMEDDPSLTPGEKKRLQTNMRTIVLAANRRVDISLNAPGVPAQASQRQYPFSAADALSLIGGREKPKATPKAGAKKPVRRPARRTKKK